MGSNELRKIAAAVREEAAQRETAKMVKCGQLLQAAEALSLLQSKVKINVH